VFIHDVSDLIFGTKLHAQWASMNVTSIRPIAWRHSRHLPSWRFYSHCGIEEIGSPGIICIICHQVLCHQSEQGTRSMRKHLLAKAHISTLNKLTESELSALSSTTIDETALNILKRQGSCGITIESLRKKIDIRQLDSTYNNTLDRHNTPIWQ